MVSQSSFLYVHMTTFRTLSLTGSRDRAFRLQVKYTEKRLNSVKSISK
jgi:hypothetical protein